MKMINEKHITNALAQSISEVQFTGDCVKYLYDVNQVMNRYKTNLYLLMDESKSNVDPASVIQFVLRSSVELNGIGCTQSLVKVNPTILKVYGTRAYGPEVYIEYEPFQCTIDISDKFIASAIAGVRDGLFIPSAKGLSKPAHITCNKSMLDHPDVLESNMSTSFQLTKNSNWDGTLSIIMSGIIFPHVLDKGRSKCPSMFECERRLTPKKRGIAMVR